MRRNRIHGPIRTSSTVHWNLCRRSTSPSNRVRHTYRHKCYREFPWSYRDTRTVLGGNHWDHHCIEELRAVRNVREFATATKLKSSRLRDLPVGDYRMGGCQSTNDGWLDLLAIPDPLHRCVTVGFVVSENSDGKIMVPTIGDVSHVDNSHTYGGILADPPTGDHLRAPPEVIA